MTRDPHSNPCTRNRSNHSVLQFFKRLFTLISNDEEGTNVNSHLKMPLMVAVCSKARRRREAMLVPLHISPPSLITAEHEKSPAETLVLPVGELGMTPPADDAVATPPKLGWYMDCIGLLPDIDSPPVRFCRFEAADCPMPLDPPMPPI